MAVVVAVARIRILRECDQRFDGFPAALVHVERKCTMRAPGVSCEAPQPPKDLRWRSDAYATLDAPEILRFAQDRLATIRDAPPQKRPLHELRPHVSRRLEALSLLWLRPSARETGIAGAALHA